ncbi:MAG TPA: hypothetical protein VEY51_12425 [Chondromyces sp.]|nr:hypothetical protein [Chondromyces sp.]
MDKKSARLNQDHLEQYRMPEAVRNAKKRKVQVGYEASTGNRTDPDHEISKEL